MRAGIDPGITGALALLNDDLTVVAVKDMPTVTNGKKQEINTVELGNILEYWNYNPGLIVILEEVGARPTRFKGEDGQMHERKGGTTSAFTFGDSFGCVRGVCGALKIPLIRVTPQSWKSRCGLIKKPKDVARTIAQQLYPEVDLSLKKHGGRADALLIARFGGSL